MREVTRVVRSSLTPVVAGTAMHGGPVFAAAFHTPGDPAASAYSYARAHNPTWTELEHAIASLESGGVPLAGAQVTSAVYEARALVFASGMAAISAVFGAILRPGDVVVTSGNSYYTARNLLNQYFSQIGVEVRTTDAMAVSEVASTNASRAEELAKLFTGARLVWVETPSNPSMDICDIAAVCEAAHRAGALVAVDNTTATPLGQKPLALGADFSVASDTKSMTGHSDLLLGHVAVRDAELYTRIDQWRTLTGAIVGPMEAWLALRSIITLPLRLERSCANAMRIAEYLSTRSEVSTVLYPGLPTHPGYAVAARQMRYFGPVLGFVLRDKAAAETFLAKSELLTEATSFGGITTTAERRARWGGDAIEDGFIRLSAGCEAVEDLIEDLSQALNAVR